MNPYRTGKLVLFEAFYDPSSTWIIYELIPFALLGVLGVHFLSFFLFNFNLI